MFVRSSSDDIYEIHRVILLMIAIGLSRGIQVCKRTRKDFSFSVLFFFRSIILCNYLTDCRDCIRILFEMWNVDIIFLSPLFFYGQTRRTTLSIQIATFTFDSFPRTIRHNSIVNVLEKIIW